MSFFVSLLSTFFCTDTDMEGPNRRMREKIQDEYDAMMICREKVAQRGLPMQIVDAEYQWLVSFLLSASTLYFFSLQFLLTFFYFYFLLLILSQGSTQTHILLQGG